MAVPAISKTYAAQERRWKAEEALRTMQRVEEIKRDTGLMRDARALAKQQMQSLAKVAKAPAKRK